MHPSQVDLFILVCVCLFYVCCEMGNGSCTIFGSSIADTGENLDLVLVVWNTNGPYEVESMEQLCGNRLLICRMQILQSLSVRYIIYVFHDDIYRLCMHVHAK